MSSNIISLQNKHTLTKEGYIIKKKDINNTIIEKIKKELTVEPHMTFKQGNMKPQKFTVYKETPDTLLYQNFMG